MLNVYVNESFACVLIFASLWHYDCLFQHSRFGGDFSPQELDALFSSKDQLEDIPCGFMTEHGGELKTTKEEAHASREAARSGDSHARVGAA